MTLEHITSAAGDYMMALKAAKKAYNENQIDETPEALNAAAATILIHATKIHPGGLSSNGNGHTTLPAGVPDHDEDVFADAACKYCGGDVWDNTAPRSKKNPRGPDYKCKDASCGGAAWINKDKTISWKK